MTQEALKLALEALETNNKAWKSLADSGDAGWWEAEEQPFFEISVKAITAIKEALAQHDSVQEKPEPEQEPVAVVVQVQHPAAVALKLKADVPVGTTLYTTPPQRKWVGLTPDEIRGISLASGESLFSAIMFTHDKLKEKCNG